MKQKLDTERYKLLRSVERLFEGPMIFLGFAWMILLIVELLYGLNKTMEIVSLGIWVLFIIDFLLKLVLAPAKIRFLKTNWLTVISLLIPALRIFRAIRFIRLLRGLRGIRLVRVVSSVNRSMRSLSATMHRRGFLYVFLLTLVVIFAGAAGMYGLENGTQGFQTYGMALWWTAMRVVTAGSEFWPVTPEGRALAFLVALYGYAVFGYVTATLATFFIGRDAEESNTAIAGKIEIKQLQQQLAALSALLEQRTEESVSKAKAHGSDEVLPL